MSKNSNKKSRNTGRNDSYTREKGHFEIAWVGSTSNVGAFVVNQVEIDTDLAPIWQQLANIFEQWRVLSMRFHFIPNGGSTTSGTIYMAATDDGDSTIPGVEQDICSLRTAVCSCNWQRAVMTYKPMNKIWLYTHDQALSTDRLEMPGTFLMGSSGASTSFSPGRVFVDYDVEFRAISNSTVAPMHKRIKDLPLTEDEEGQQKQLALFLKFQKQQAVLHSTKKDDGGLK